MSSSTASWKPAALRAAACLLLYTLGWVVTGLSGNGAGVWIFAAACAPGGWGLAKESWRVGSPGTELEFAL